MTACHLNRSVCIGRAYTLTVSIARVTLRRGCNRPSLHILATTLTSFTGWVGPWIATLATGA
jgi:hypothetical protein